MLSLKDFKKFEVSSDSVSILGGFDAWSCSCNGGDGGFSSVGSSINIAMIRDVCGREGASCLGLNL